MKKITFISTIISIFMILGLASCSKASSPNNSKEVVVYTYDSFAGEWGPAAQIAEEFNKATGYTVVFVDCGDAVQALTRAIMDKDNNVVDVVVGIDNNLVYRAREAGIFEEYKPEGADTVIDPALKKELGDDWLFTPYDYSHFAMIYDTQSSVPAPASLMDLANPCYEKKIILMDPRTSTPGLGFLSWTQAQFTNQKDFEAFWTALKPNILAMTSGWSEGWGMFSNGEAPLCVSYTTSPAYNVEYDNDYRFQAVVFEEGHVQQVEGYGLLKNAPNKKGAKAFMDFMISKTAQEALPLTQWMYPANSQVTVPESYNKAAPIPAVTIPTDAKATAEVLDTVLQILGK